MDRLKIAFVGKSKEANTYCARYLWKKWKFRFFGLDDELDKTLRRFYSSRSNFRPKINYQTRLRFYDVWHEIDPDIFVNYIINRVNDPRATRNIVIPDARYLNEVKRLEEEGFIFIRVTVDEKFYSKKTTHIPTIKNTTTAGAVDYYEWFPPKVDMTINAQFSVHLETYGGLTRSIDQIISNLTGGELLPYNGNYYKSSIIEVENGKAEISTLDKDFNRRD